MGIPTDSTMTTQRLNQEQIEALASRLPLWTVTDTCLHRQLVFKNFVEAFGFMAQVGSVSGSTESPSKLEQRLQPSDDRAHHPRSWWAQQP
jgi:hypothetical protein